MPAAHPHVHIRVTNAALIVVDVAAIRQYIQFIVLSFGDGVNTVTLYRRGDNYIVNGGQMVEQLETAITTSIKRVVSNLRCTNKLESRLPWTCS